MEGQTDGQRNNNRGTYSVERGITLNGTFGGRVVAGDF